MPNNQEQNVLAAACEDFGIPLAKDVLDAIALRDAARKMVSDTRAETAPDPDSVTAKNLRDLHAAMVAWPAHAERVAAADRLATVTDSKLSAAWQSFASRLLDAFRKPFDDTAARVLAGDASAIPALHQLDAVRDIVANASTRAHCRSDVLERVTRILVVPSYEVALNRLRIRTDGHERLSAAWCHQVVDLGCQIKWQTPAEQEAADKALAKSAPDAA